MLEKSNPVAVEIEHPLSALIDSCERTCVADCCGIDAFDFSPLFAAAYLASHYGEIRNEDIISLRNQVCSLREQYCLKPLQDIEYVIQIKSMNQNFTSSGFSRFLDELEFAFENSKEVFEVSESLTRKRAEQAVPPKSDRAGG